MKQFGVVVIMIGIILFIFNAFPYSIEQTTFSGKNIEISPSRTPYYFIFPRYIGFFIAVFGIILIYAAQKRPKY